MKYINLNGKISIIANAIVPVDNGAFRYGYGLYETLYIENNVIRFKEYHWERLFNGLKQLYFAVPSFMTAEWLEEEIRQLVRKNQAERLCRVRLQMFAGAGGLYSAENNQPGYIIECLTLDNEMIKFNENGLVVGLATELKKSMDGLSNLKSCNALIYAMGARQAREHKWNDALQHQWQHHRKHTGQYILDKRQGNIHTTVGRWLRGRRNAQARTGNHKRYKRAKPLRRRPAACRRGVPDPCHKKDTLDRQHGRQIL